MHHLGNPCDMIKINKIAKKYNLFILEDGANPRSKNWKKHVGNFGDAGVFHSIP